MRGSVAVGVAIPVDRIAHIRTWDVELPLPVALAVVALLAVVAPLAVVALLVLSTPRRAGTVPILLFKRVLRPVARWPPTVLTACLMVQWLWRLLRWGMRNRPVHRRLSCNRRLKQLRSPRKLFANRLPGIERLWSPPSSPKRNT